MPGAEGNVNINLQGNVFEQLQKISQQMSQLNTRVTSVESSSKKSFESIAKSVKSINLVALTQGFEQFTRSLDAVNAPGISFNKSLAELSAITGLVGDDLANLGETARENAKEFGGDAASSVETYKLLLSQLGPQLAETPKLLNEMSRSAAILSKTMDGDTAAATRVLTTAMNQYSVDMSDPVTATAELNRMMNIMSASAQAGSSELPVLQQALANSGQAANAAGVSFEETMSALQGLDKASFEGGQGGIALRNILSTLSQGRFLPKDVQKELTAAGISVDDLADTSLTLSDRLNLLQPVMNDTALLGKLFGRETKDAAIALIQNTESMDQMTGAIVNTNTSFEQANVIMETVAEKLARQKAAIDDAKIAFFEATGGLSAYLGPLAQVGTTMAGFAPVVSLVGKAFKATGIQTALYNLAIGITGALTGKANIKIGQSKIALFAYNATTKAVTAAQWLWNAALSANPIGAVALAIAALTVGVIAITKAFGQATAAERVNTALKQRTIEKTADERAELELLFAQLKETNVGSDERNKLTDELNNKYPELLSNYNLETASLSEINEAQQEIIKNIEKRARAEAASELLTENYKAQLELKNRENSTWENITSLGQQWVVDANKGLELAGLKAEGEELLNEVLKTRNDELGQTINSELVLSDSTTDQEDTEKSIKNVIDTKTKRISGSKSSKNVTVHIGNLVNNLNISRENAGQTDAEIRQKLSEILTGVVRDFETAQ